MQTNSLIRLGGIALVLSGAFYICDTLADWQIPGNTFGFGIGVSCFGLFGMTTMYFVALRVQGVIGLLAYVLTSMGLTGLAGISFFNNLLRPLLDPETIGVLLGGPALVYFVATGVIFLIGGLFLAAAVWKAPVFPKATAPLYIVGCIPVALPPAFPPVATEAGGLAISLALIAWGVSLFRNSAQMGETPRA